MTQAVAQEESTIISNSDLRWIACVVYSSRQIGHEVSDNDLEVMYRNSQLMMSRRYNENEISPFFYHCLAGSKQLGIKATEDATRDVNSIVSNSIVLLHTDKKTIVPVVFLRVEGNEVELTKVLPEE